MTEIKDRHVDWERLPEIRRMVKALPVEDQREGARLNGRYWALRVAIEVLSGERAIATEEYREDVLENLEELKDEAGAAFRSFREERGIPDVVSGGRREIL